MEELPSLIWGLDPVFLAFAKLYIRDILELKESNQVPGIFFYNGHPIKQVDILGTVVSVREKEAFYSYGVDDSSGVINCTCWKSSGPKCLSSSVDQKSTSKAKDLDGFMQELYRQESRQAKMEIGEVIRVRGYIKVFRNQREVVASVFYKVEDPTLDVQISQMLDLPHLYRNVYDKPFIIPDHLRDPSHGISHDAVLSHSGLILQLSEKIKEFLDENQICNFYQGELESVPILLSTATKPSHNTEAGEGSSVTSREIHNVFKDAIQLLREKGIVYLKGHKTGVYQVTDQDKELHKLALNIIQEDCRRQRHADKGCHLLHILNCVQLTLGSSINETILQRVIDTLERNSDIISTMEKYYTSF
ncbi:CST complex subunit STN1 isoform X2 [Hyla sarda]|nr:CST complex subunit STN1 isoform X2 [Hyla sarda]XP_056385145.1 CST complex subunit STN1 isoform X2 [Hyla sarda]XP_056385146.1 CST complex subunit STN1 isoform X2 [Hyla sarda]XP_056385148.1 CST complex subunit STN1 isoform X2 [Hyla sarda]XP_056385149.1 CST complex subunit STN1 isoform X2 [Hyla sarda]